MEIKPIATIKNDYDSKFAVPRQSGIADKIMSQIVFENEFADENAIRGMDGFSHLWLIWGFSKNIKNKQNLTVRPPRLGGNERVGVFASRSPFRPNNLGLSSVRLEKIEHNGGKPILIVSGADLINGTPIYDIKPYVAYTDSHADAVCGFVDKTEFSTLNVKFAEGTLSKIAPQKAEVLKEILSNDPRPAYDRENERIYGFKFAHREIKFKVVGKELTVVSIENER